MCFVVLCVRDYIYGDVCVCIIEVCSFEFSSILYFVILCYEYVLATAVLSCDVLVL
jgi:hypothetical protein